MEFFENIFAELPYMGIILLIIWLFIKYMRDRDDKFVSALGMQSSENKLALEKHGQENRDGINEIAKENRESNQELVKSLIRIETKIDTRND